MIKVQVRRTRAPILALGCICEGLQKALMVREHPYLVACFAHHPVSVHTMPCDPVGAVELFQEQDSRHAQCLRRGDHLHSRGQFTFSSEGRQAQSTRSDHHHFTLHSLQSCCQLDDHVPQVRHVLHPFQFKRPSPSLQTSLNLPQPPIISESHIQTQTPKQSNTQEKPNDTHIPPTTCSSSSLRSSRSSSRCSPAP